MPENPTTNDSHGSPKRPGVRCPRCRTKFPVSGSIAGKRLRCPACHHVWRDQRPLIRDARQALAKAADHWAELDSTAIAAVDHASTIGHLSKKLRKRETFPPSDWVGKKLGKYEIRAVLGQGAMGYVYEGHEVDLNRAVAIKLLPRYRAPGQPMTIGEKMFLQEARAAARLQHPNVVTIFEVGEQEGYPYFAMELIHGATLMDLVNANGPLGITQGCYVIANAARALAAGHRHGIVHRDVKPGNIMIDETGTVKLTDFGLADVLDNEDAGHIEGIALGTPGWISPEAARGEAAVPESDIYGLGLTLHFALTGDRLIKGSSRSELIKAQREAKDIDLSRLPNDWPERLKQVVCQTLQVKSEDRYHDAELLAADLIRAIRPDSRDQTITLDLGTHIGERPKIAPWSRRVALALLLVILATLAAWYGGLF